MSAKSCLGWPEIYSVGQDKKLFNPLAVTLTLLYSLYSSIILFFVPMAILQHSALDFQTLAITVETSVVFTSTVEVTRFTNPFDCLHGMIDGHRIYMD